MNFEFESKVWLWPANEKWFFASLPEDLSNDIKELSEGLTNGFGSLKVEARIGLTVWHTSIFPDSKLGVFVLPLKAEVRKKHNLEKDSLVTIQLKLLGF